MNDASLFCPIIEGNEDAKNTLGKPVDDLIELLSNYVISVPVSAVLCISGSWGTGKTTVLNLIRYNLLSKHRDEIIVCWYNPWEHEHHPNPMMSLLLSLQRQLPKRIASNPKVQVALRSVLRLATNIGLRSISGMLATQTGIPVGTTALIAPTLEEIEDIVKREKASAEPLYFDEVYELREALKKYISSCLSRRKRLIILIDDLDRCLPETSIRLLEAMKLFLLDRSRGSGKGRPMIVLCALDRGLLTETLRTKFHGVVGFDSEAYFQKLFDESFEIPGLSDVDFVEHLQELVARTLGEKRQHDFIDCVLASGLCPQLTNSGMTPRDLERIANRLGLLASIIDNTGLINQDPLYLGYTIVIAVLFREFRNEVLELPERLNEFSEIVRTTEYKVVPPYYERFISNRKLMSIIRPNLSHLNDIALASHELKSNGL